MKTLSLMTQKGINFMEKKWMKLALKIAKKGEGKVSPNPMVGAVITRDGQMIASGFHQYFGGPHAEVEAIKKAKDKVKGTTLYVTLEPCCHYGKTPPCTKKIIQSGIRRVVVATLDPNPLVSGKGVEELRTAGIDVDIGICEEEAKEVNEAYLKFIKKRIPFVIVKVAASLDGKIATHLGESKWITGSKSRDFAHRLRDKVDAILVGVNTVIKDNPSLLSPSQKHYIRVILDSKLRISLEAQVLKDQDKADTFIFTTHKAEKQKIKELNNRGVKIVMVKDEEERVDISEVLKKLGGLEIMKLLVEGGGEVIASFFEKKFVDKLFLFFSPRIIGGRKTLSWVEGRGINFLKESPWVKIDSLRRIGEDFLFEGHVNYI